MTDSLSSDQLAQALQEWFVRGSAPICWVQDANSGGVAATARPLLASTPGSYALWLAFANPDRCLFDAFGTVCAAMLREKLTSEMPPLVFIDALDRAQLATGELADARLADMLHIAADKGKGQSRVLVRSALPPPGWAQATLCLRATSTGDTAVDIRYQEDELDFLERKLCAHLAAAEVHAAVMCYWQEIGNFQRLAAAGAMHRGLRMCWLLNHRLPPTTVDPSLASSPGALAVLNDWSVLALCLGEVATAGDAARAALSVAGEDTLGSDRGMIEGHLAEALWQQGLAGDAMAAAVGARHQVLHTLRTREGIPTEDVMTAYDGSYHMMLRAAIDADDRASAAAVFDEWIDVHSLARRNLGEFNSLALVPLGGPKGQPELDDIHHGLAAASFALCEERWMDALSTAQRVLARQPAGWSRGRHGLQMRLLQLQALRGAGDAEAVYELITRLKQDVDDADDSSLCGHLAIIQAELALNIGNAELCSRVASDAAGWASRRGLIRLQTALLQVKAEALDAIGQGVEAAATRATRAALPGPQPVPRPPRITPPRSSFKPAPNSRRQPGERRSKLHEEALEVIERFRERGLPFGLSFRVYSFVVFHGPMEFGPRLLENVLQAAMPKNASMLAIQDHDDQFAFAREDTRFARSAPALHLDDAEWQDVATSLIAHADLIVSECYFLTPAVRFELETAARFGKWDRTVLLLPPQSGQVTLIDNDPLVQQFPRCVWADRFHTQSLTELPQVADLVDRMARIASCPESYRCGLAKPLTREAAFPVSILPLAEEMEREARLSLQRNEVDLPRVRHEAFWNLFRAASLRGVALQRGDDSADNRIQLSSDQVDMSGLMLAFEKEDERFVLLGDLDTAERLAASAWALLDLPGLDRDGYFRRRAERQWQNVQRVKSAIAAAPERVSMRTVFGPLAGVGHNGVKVGA